MKNGLKVTEKIEHQADKATQWVGSTKSVLLHSIVFATAFLLPVFGVDFDRMLLILTTAVSLEAIYLAIFIQMSVNKNSQHIEEIQENVGEIQEDIEEIEKDVDEIQEDIEEEQEKDVQEDRKLEKKLEVLNHMQEILRKLSEEIEQLKKK